MLNKAWHDFWDSFRWNNVKKIYNNFAVIWMYVYFMMLPLITRADKKMMDVAGFYIWLIALYFAILVSSVVRIRLPKQMFLCPMNAVERRSYLRMMLQLKLAIPALIAVIVTIVNLIRGRIPWMCLLVTLFACVAMTICISVTTWPGSIWYNNQTVEQQKIKRVSDPRFKGLTAYSLIGLGIGLILQISIMMFMEMSDTESTVFWVFILLSSLVLLIMAIRVLCYTPVIIDIAADYEKTFEGEAQLKAEKV